MTQDTGNLTLDAQSFTGPERMRCQREFGATFGDLMQCLFDEVKPPEDGNRIKITDGAGVRRFPDEIIQFMLWVQSQRNDRDAELSDFDDLRYLDLTNSYVRGLMGKGQQKSKHKKSSTGSTSAVSSQDSPGSSPAA